MSSIKKIVFVLLVFTSAIACSKSDNTVEKKTIEPGNDPNFTIVANTDNQLQACNRKVVVFGIDIYAVPNVSDSKLLHAANVMAQYLDNDEDGTVDNQKVLDQMLENKAFLIMWKNENDMNMDWPDDRIGQDLGNDETNTNYVEEGKKGRFDASLEEVWHIITHAGYSMVYPDVLGENAGTSISNSMDIARGGNFTDIPSSYPEGAWYTYDDSTCEYDCQVTEYFYWAMSSILGAQENRFDEIGHEWKLNTKEKVRSTDTKVFQLLTNVEYKLPTILPDGSYRH
jgi:hypothetical protein